MATVEAQMDAAHQHYANKEYATARLLYGLAADQGDAQARFILGAMHAQGQGGPQDYAAARRWYGLAADQGHADAQYNLGIMHDQGRCLERGAVGAGARPTSARHRSADFGFVRRRFTRRRRKPRLVTALLLTWVTSVQFGFSAAFRLGGHVTSRPSLRSLLRVYSFAFTFAGEKKAAPCQSR